MTIGQSTTSSHPTAMSRITTSTTSNPCAEPVTAERKTGYYNASHGRTLGFNRGCHKYGATQQNGVPKKKGGGYPQNKATKNGAQPNATTQTTKTNNKHQTLGHVLTALLAPNPNQTPSHPTNNQAHHNKHKQHNQQQTQHTNKLKKNTKK